MFVRQELESAIVNFWRSRLHVKGCLWWPRGAIVKFKKKNENENKSENENKNENQKTTKTSENENKNENEKHL